jgi:nitrogenase molybdenum-iron protein beta chain
MLNGTTANYVERKALRINPAKTCQPIGAMYAALGIHRCLPHSHGSQGCCSYHRSHLTRHFKEPVMATTSSFTEGASVFGGLSNMTTALTNIFTIYNPDVVAVHTTCLSEVIGDDIPMMFKKFRDEGKLGVGKYLIHANTPSFVGSHVTGFANMTTAMVKYLSEKSGATRNQLNLLPGYLDPADMRELKRIAGELGIQCVMFPDTSDVLDTPQIGHFEMYPKGGATVEQIRSAGDSFATLGLGFWASEDAACELETKCEVPYEMAELPIGLTATDRYVDALRRLASVEVPESINRERGQLLDLMSDMSQYLHRKRVAVFGDPDHVLPLCRFLIELDMRPAYVISGTSGKAFEENIQQLVGPDVPEVRVHAADDLFTLHQWIKAEPVDLLIGNTYGKYIARAEGHLPFVRFGFPILDRAAHRYFPSIGYCGAMRLVTAMTDALLDKKDRECPEEFFELVQ